ncbi:hypothetical protein BH23CHL2_BH23CHL2_18800 [soil metagenome]
MKQEASLAVSRICPPELTAREFSDWAFNNEERWRTAVGAQFNHSVYGLGSIVDVRPATAARSLFVLTMSFDDGQSTTTMYSDNIDSDGRVRFRFDNGSGSTFEKHWLASLVENRSIFLDREREQFDHCKSKVSGINRDEISDLHFITDVANVPSILWFGILSRNKVQDLGLEYQDFSLESVQQHRKRRTTADGLSLHHYANLYFFAHNITLYRILKNQPVSSVCVLAVDPAVVDMPYTHISDGNLGSHRSTTWPSPEGLQLIDKDALFSWVPHKFPDQRRIQCAEVQVLGWVDPRLIRYIYVPNLDSEAKLKESGVGRPMRRWPELFHFEG